MNWREFEDELRRRRPVHFWWRDDDAAAVTPELTKLLALATRYAVPLSLAVIPEAAEPELFRMLDERVSVLQHGTDHRNRAAPEEKKTEYPQSEPIESALRRIADGAGRLRALARGKFFPALVPPWNRVRADLLNKLPAIGVVGLSAYGPRESAEPRPGLRQLNTHVDLVAWREGQKFLGESEALAAAFQTLKNEQPVGWLTHHAVHDAQAWAFLERLFSLTDVRWLSAPEAFSYTRPAHG